MSILLGAAVTLLSAQSIDAQNFIQYVPQPAPQYQQPAPQYSQPAPQYQQYQQQYQQPAPQYQQPAQQYVQPQPDRSGYRTILYPQGVARLKSYPEFNALSYELYQAQRNGGVQILEVRVCGSSSPEGNYQENLTLAALRTEFAAKQLKNILNVPESKIRKENLGEDWDGLYALVAASNIPYKDEVLWIIRTKTMTERKQALKSLANGYVWGILSKEFFPQMRCVKFAVYCSAPQGSGGYVPSYNPNIPFGQKDTIYVMQDNKKAQKQQYKPQPQQEEVVLVLENGEGTPVVRQVKKVPKPKTYRPDRVYHDTPWFMGFKTNVLADIAVLPNIALEVQLAERMSFEIGGTYSTKNIFFPTPETKIYSVNPELRYWTRQAMQTGHFFGLHANFAWYTTKWKDGLLYQNTGAPAYSVGLTYGYSMKLDRRDRLGLEFFIGVGYGSYKQMVGQQSEVDLLWYEIDNQTKTHVGVTKLGVNLRYNFSLRRVK